MPQVRSSNPADYTRYDPYGSGAVRAKELQAVQKKSVKPKSKSSSRGIFEGIANQQPATAGGRPEYPVYQNPAALAKEATLTRGPAININTEALDRLRSESMAPSSQSPWLKMQMQRINLNRNADIGSAMRQAAGQTGQARTSLAMRGGLSGGAAERLALGGQQQARLGQQDIRQGARQAELAAGQAAEENRLANLRALPGMETQLYGARAAERGYGTDVDQYNIGNILREQQLKNAFGLGKYSEDMKGYSAEQMAKAIAAAGQRQGTFNKFLGGDLSGALEDIGGGGQFTGIGALATGSPYALPVTSKLGVGKRIGF